MLILFLVFIFFPFSFFFIYLTFYSQMNQYKAFNRHDVHKWLINIPNYHENYQTNSSNEIEESSLTRKERPLSLLSLNSEDSISLDDFINANYTPSMDDEIDLLSLSSLHLDDNSEEFWKVDNVNHLFPFLSFFPRNSKMYIFGFFIK
ncbi:uncharacterized protein BX663DRAFT_312628 [Cokeromyces recurvatus]|uniref:uncharacterized protein n=1 Tax=Cokeromyces recurvatus TaxID=90255 RepID=UPI00222121BA|nr:uncharacterized protein BX663DRAFT_312628 [Cokeromyces recurvatus]KAI7905158.1 hypothetical protein BX663DRAFT_312628 [Cokeromyces recurvatus]